MLAAFFVPVALQASAMLVDELWFHRRRGLPRWERIGHPLDTLTIVVCLVWLLASAPRDGTALAIYIGLATLSCVFVTKDEGVHATRCNAGEHWLHAVLFVLHPIVLAAFALAWWTGHDELLVVQLAITLGFFAYQVVYWNVVMPRLQGSKIDNTWYAGLGARWYTARDTPIALLRAESRHRNPWIAGAIARHRDGRPACVLDLGCGAGFLANYLAAAGHRVTGIDTTAENLVVARQYDRTGQVTYAVADACALPFAAGTFDVVCTMDLIEHVENPEGLIAEASRVLAPGGQLYFHTFNRNWLAYLIVIKGVELFVANTPKDLHVLRLFRTPDEIAAMLQRHELELACLRGSRPRFRWPLWRMLLTGNVGDDFAFTFTRSTKLGFTGYASKPGPYLRTGTDRARAYSVAGRCESELGESRCAPSSTPTASRSTSSPPSQPVTSASDTARPESTSAAMLGDSGAS